MASPTPHFDARKFATNVGDDPALLQEVIELFIELQPGRMRDLGAALRREEGAKVRSIAHALKGAFLSMAMTRLASTAALIEQRGTFGDHKSARESFVELEIQFEQVLEELASLRSTGSPHNPNSPMASDARTMHRQEN